MTQQRMKKYAYQHRSDLEFQLTPQIWKKVNNKTVHRGIIPEYNRPFEVIKKVGHIAYRLKPLDKLKIHLIFHVSFLKPFYQDEMDGGRRQAKCAPPVIRKKFQNDVKALLDYRMMGQRKKNRWTNYLIHWNGETKLDATWERDVTLWQFQDKIAEYLKNVRKQTKLTRASTSSGGVVYQPLRVRSKRKVHDRGRFRPIMVKLEGRR